MTGICKLNLLTIDSGESISPRALFGWKIVCLSASEYGVEGGRWYISLCIHNRYDLQCLFIYFYFKYCFIINKNDFLTKIVLKQTFFGAFQTTSFFVQSPGDKKTI